MYKLSENDKRFVDALWERIDKKLQWVAPEAKDKLPYTTINGVYNNMAEDDVSWWTNGFWGGLMWLMYIGTGNVMYRGVAERAEELLDGAFEEYDKLHHDVGFMWHITAGVNYRVTGAKKSYVRASIAADILASRFNIKGGFIRSWNDEFPGRVIIDSMMNIPLLYWASRETGDDRFRHIAVAHADKLMTSHIRSDGSVNHIVHLDPETGAFEESFGGQGYGEGSSWTRGQAWALYGYVLSYIHTGDVKYLDISKRVAHYFIANICDEWVSRVDFRSPEEPVMYDTTAAACAACGLLELARVVPEYEKRLYLNSAMNILKALDAGFCDWSDKEQSILQKGTEAYHREATREIPLIYGDYFLTEAVYKLRGNKLLFW